MLHLHVELELDAWAAISMPVHADHLSWGPGAGAEEELR